MVGMASTIASAFLSNAGVIDHLNPTGSRLQIAQPHANQIFDAIGPGALVSHSAAKPRNPHAPHVGLLP
jgi:hypothetical protein